MNAKSSQQALETAKCQTQKARFMWAFFIALTLSSATLWGPLDPLKKRRKKQKMAIGRRVYNRVSSIYPSPDPFFFFLLVIFKGSKGSKGPENNKNWKIKKGPKGTKGSKVQNLKKVDFAQNFSVHELSTFCCRIRPVSKGQKVPNHTNVMRSLILLNRATQSQHASKDCIHDRNRAVVKEIPNTRPGTSRDPFRLPLRSYGSICLAIIFLGLFTLSGHSQPGQDPIARFTHDFRGSHELFSYSIGPQKSGDHAKTASKTFYDHLMSYAQTPRTGFRCIWHTPKTSKSKTSTPNEIDLSCRFSTQPFQIPISLTEQTELLGRIKRSSLEATWRQMGEDYELTRFEVEISDHGKMFRSIHHGDDLAEFNLSQTDMIFPKSPNDPFRFKFEANIPSRFHAGDKPGRRTIAITVQGEALPLPSPYED